MISADEALRNLADRVQCAPGAPPLRRREALEATLLPLIRCALRTGRGAPRLVRWVQQTLPELTRAQPPGQPVDPDRVAPSMARLLCTSLLQQAQAQAGAARETVLA